MKGVVLAVCPEATLVDIGHDIPAHDVLAGALELAAWPDMASMGSKTTGKSSYSTRIRSRA